MASEVIIFFAALAGIIFIGYFAEIIFKKTKIPDVLILIFLGIIIGSGFNLIDKSNFGFTASLFTTFTLVYLLFQGSLNIDFKTLLQSLKGTVKLTTISFITATLTISVTTLLLFGFDIPTSLLVGMILSGTSSAVVIPIVSNIKADKKYTSILTLESAISDVLAIVGSITIIAIIIEGDLNGVLIVKNILSSFVLAMFLGATIGFLWLLILAKSKDLTDSYMVTIAVVMALYALVESPFVSASGAIAVLSFGLIMGNSKTIITKFKKINGDKKESKILTNNILSNSARNFYSEISFFVKVFFFVYLGILFDFSQLNILFYGLIITIVIYIVRIPTVKLAFYKEKIDPKSKSLLRYLIPKGLAAAALAQLAVQQNIPHSSDILNTVFSVILISIIMTSVLVFLMDKKTMSKPQKETLENKKEDPNDKESIFPAIFFNKPLS